MASDAPAIDRSGTAMASARTRIVLTHAAAIIFGAIVGAVSIIWLRAYVSRPLAAMKCYLAMQANDAGNEDKAIIMLSQASVEDRDSYLPWELLAQIYLHQGKTDMALVLYRKALDLLNRKSDFLLLPTAHSQEKDLIQKKIDELQKQVDDQQHNEQRSK